MLGGRATLLPCFRAGGAETLRPVQAFLNRCGVGAARIAGGDYWGRAEGVAFGWSAGQVVV